MNLPVACYNLLVPNYNCSAISNKLFFWQFWACLCKIVSYYIIKLQHSKPYSLMTTHAHFTDENTEMMGVGTTAGSQKCLWVRNLGFTAQCLSLSFESVHRAIKGCVFLGGRFSQCKAFPHMSFKEDTALVILLLFIHSPGDSPSVLIPHVNTYLRVQTIHKYKWEDLGCVVFVLGLSTSSYILVIIASPNKSRIVLLVCAVICEFVF